MMRDEGPRTEKCESRDVFYVCRERDVQRGRVS